MNKENLLKLAEFLETLDSSKFDMVEFRTAEAGALRPDEVSTGGCGTVACAVGWTPEALGIPEGKLCYYTSWTRLARDYYGVTYLGTLIGAYLFSWLWGSYEPTATQAAARIRRVVNGFIPSRDDLPWISEEASDA